MVTDIATVTNSQWRAYIGNYHRSF